MAEVRKHNYLCQYAATTYILEFALYDASCTEMEISLFPDIKVIKLCQDLFEK